MQDDVVNRPLKLKIAAALVGLACHIVFASCVTLMFVQLSAGMQLGYGTFKGLAAGIANFGLILQFPLLHSFLLTSRGQKILTKLSGKIGRDLNTTTYALIASLQLILTFALWSPSGLIIEQPSGFASASAMAAFILSWVYLAIAMNQAGLDLQSGFLGWWAIVRGTRPKFPTFPTCGAFGITRQPIYLAFALIMWTAPLWSLDGLVLASCWTVYCVYGPVWKEARCIKFYGDEFRRYQFRTPYFFPSLGLHSFYVAVLEFFKLNEPTPPL